MYKIIVLFILLTHTLFSQVEYPCFKIDSIGQKVIIMTIEQAQSLDNQTDLLPLFERMNNQISQVDSSCVKTINDRDKVINSQQKQIDSQKDLINNKNKEIVNINYHLSNYKLSEDTYIKEIDNKNKEIDLHINQLNKLRGRVIISGGIGVIVGFVVGILVFR